MMWENPGKPHFCVLFFPLTHSFTQGTASPHVPPELLGDERQVAAQGVEPQRGDVHAVDAHRTVAGVLGTGKAAPVEAWPGWHLQS